MSEKTRQNMPYLDMHEKSWSWISNPSHPLSKSEYLGEKNCPRDTILIIHRIKVHILVNNKLRKKFGYTRLLPTAIFWPFSTGLEHGIYLIKQEGMGPMVRGLEAGLCKTDGSKMIYRDERNYWKHKRSLQIAFRGIPLNFEIPIGDSAKKNMGGGSAKLFILLPLRSSNGIALRLLNLICSDKYHTRIDMKNTFQIFTYFVIYSSWYLVWV